MGFKAPFGVVIALAIAAAMTPAKAQFEPLAFAICKKITADTARLKCFDEIGGREDGKAAPPPPVGKWTYEESRSPVDDSAQVNAMLRGEPEGVGLVLRCKERKTEAIFVPAGFFVAGMTDQVPVLMRLNEEQPIKVFWNKSTNGSAVFVPDPIGFIRLLNDNGKLFIRANGFEGRTADGLFQLADVSSAREKIESACKWSTPKSAREAIPAKNAMQEKPRAGK